MPASRALKRLNTEAYINLATFRRNGTAVETPVWFAMLGGKLYVVTDGTSAKVKRTRATKRVRLAPCNVWGGVTGDWIDGTGRVLKEGRLIERAHAALEKKYGWQMWLLDTVSRLFGRIGRRAYLELSVGAAADARE
jgi:PPOX class probable F420-dependent enzyme